MEAHLRVVKVYVRKDGKAPYNEWFNSLWDIKARAKVRVRLDRVRLGNLGDCKSVGEGVHELKIDWGAGYRVYFGQEGKEIIILLSGGDKQKQEKDIQLAKTYWEDYKRRSDEN